MRFLVDAAHWAGHRKMKRNQNRNVRGHTGCSEGKFIVCSNEHSIKIVFILRIQLQELQGDPSWITEPGERAGPLSIG